MDKRLEYRMYGLVPYNISEIQKGIQFGHAVVEYARNCGDSEEYLLWSRDDKTFMILNGGTTNTEEGKWFGSMNKHWSTLVVNGITHSIFREPDLGNQLTAVVFLVDERIFKKRKYDWENDDVQVYPDFIDYILLKVPMIEGYDIVRAKNEPETFTLYKEWLELIGGEKNLFLRNFLSQFKLA